MNTAQTITQLSRRLESSLDKVGFPSLHKRLGQHLLAKLQQPLQIAVVGLPQSGKTSLINMLLGWTVVPDVPAASIIEVVYGPQPRTLVEYQDGALAEHAGILADLDRPDAVFRVSFELPEEQLLALSYVEVTLAGAEAQIESLLQHVVSTSSLVVWSSERFGSDEQAMWATVPDHIKDHSFLALTKADRHQMKGELAQHIADLEEIVSEEFYGLYPIATRQAIQAQELDEAEKTALWSRSGGEALGAAIDQQISQGRAEDMDRAQALLQSAKAEPSAMSPTSDHTSADQTAAPSEAQPRQETPQQDRPEPSLSVPKPRGEETIRSGSRALEAAMQSLQASAETLFQEVSAAADKPDVSNVIDVCLKSVRGMTDMLTQADQGGHATQAVMQDVQQGEDMLLLLQLEDSEDAAADAVSLMVQLKKEVTARASA